MEYVHMNSRLNLLLKIPIFSWPLNFVWYICGQFYFTAIDITWGVGRNSGNTVNRPGDRKIVVNYGIFNTGELLWEFHFWDPEKVVLNTGGMG